MFEIVSTDAGGGSAPDMVMSRRSSTPVNGDDLGVTVFKGNDATIPNPADAGYPGVLSESEYARISSEANSIDAAARNGQLDFRVQNCWNFRYPTANYRRWSFRQYRYMMQLRISE